jgi:hypothetical protein
MKAWTLAVLLALCGLSACVQADSEGSAASSGVVGKESARALAEQAFLEATAHRVPRYAMELSGGDERDWLFMARGTGEYARPGFHWLVRVNKQTGVTQVIPGE